MTMIELPVDTTTTANEEILQLEGVEYLFRFYWLDRSSVWVLNIYDQDENELALGLRLVVNVSLFGRFQDTRLPPGMLLCSDLSGADEDPRVITDLGTRVILAYITSDDPVLSG